MAAIILKIIVQWAWPFLVPFLFKFLEKKLSPGLMGFIYDLIGEQHQLILDGKVSTEEAERSNLEVIREATRSSPGLSITWAKLAHTIAYLKWCSENNPIRFEWWMDSLILFERQGKAKTTQDYMSWYLSRPDKIKP